MLQFHEDKLRKIGEAHGLNFEDENLDDLIPGETEEQVTKLKNNIIIVKKSDVNMQRVLMKDIQNNLQIINALKSKVERESDRLQSMERRVMTQVMDHASEMA